MLNSNIRLFRVKGIPVGINWTWLFIFLFFFWTLAGALFPATYPGQSGSTYLAMGALATVLFFGSILAHELSHTLRALREGVRVQEITLWLFGGVSKTEGELPSPRAELRVVAAGPIASAVLALVFLGLTALARATGAPVAVRGVTDYLARVNGILAAFNLVPALPLDGGRILHAVLWRRSGDRAAATLSAAGAGRAFGSLLVGLGLLSAVTGAGIGGIWFVVLGWYLIRAADAEAIAARLEIALGVLPTPDALRIPEGVLPAELPSARRRAGGLGVWLVVALTFAVAIAALYHPPYVVVSPGESFDIRGDITITGVPVQPLTGRYLLTSVRLSQPSALGVLLAMARSDREVLSAGDVAPKGISPGAIARFERQLYVDSQQTAAAAAATAAGYHATLVGRGAQVIGVTRSSPAASVLKAGDTITAVDGQPIRTVADLHDVVGGLPAGRHLTLTVERRGRTLPVTTTTVRLPEVSGGTGIGVVVATRDLRVVLPFSITLQARSGLGGPSAGLAYALAITDMLDPSDDARGRAVAATGTIEADGSVGPVGGVHEKAIAARRAGATVFLVASDEVSSVRDRRLQVRGVNTLQQAVHVLQLA
ncbi:MAG: conserved transrane protein [Acidimicrobiales bacterium]|nr:conserved transrane protein [Acidimicrobiales bacterium]